jgi:hypothetical protein
MGDKPRFVDNGDGTITDNDSGLIWCKKDSFQIEHDWLDFQEALKFIDEMNKKDYLGFHDWRIPESEEVEKLFVPESTLAGRSNQEVHIDPLFEPGCGNGSWCLPFDQRAAFYINFVSGIVQNYDQDYSQGYVRMVRLWGDD